MRVFPMYRAWLRAVGASCALFAYAAGGQYVVVETAARMVTGETVSTTLHAADMTEGVVFARDYPLRGAVPAGPLLITPNGLFAACATGPSPNERISDPRLDRGYLELIRINPLTPERAVPAYAPHGASWRLAAFAGGNPAPLAMLLSGAGPGTALIAQELTYDSGFLRPVQANLVPLAFEPALVSARGDAVVAAGITATGALELTLLDAADPVVRPVTSVRFAVEGLASARVTGLTHSGDGSLVYALVGGYSKDSPSGDPFSWCYAFHARSLEAAGAPLRIPGDGDAGANAIAEGYGAAAWIVTRTPGADHGTVTGVAIDEGGAAAVAQLPFFRIGSTLRVAASPYGPECVVAAGMELVRWEPEGGLSARRMFDDPIETLRSSHAALLAGEGGRLHRIDPETLEPAATVEFNSGVVVDAVTPQPPPPAVESPEPNSLRERIREALAPLRPLDMTDAGTGHFTPLHIPAAITFHGEAVRQELKAINLSLPGAEDAEWIVEYDEAAMPWLGVYPKQGTFSEPLYLVVLSPRYDFDADALVSGFITIRSVGDHPAPAEAGLPREIEVRIAPPRNAVTRVLWIWPESERGQSVRAAADPYGLGGLAELLAQPPHLYTHDEVWGPAGHRLTDYTVVVMPARVAAEGAVTRQEVLDYVAGGGALLLLGAAHDAAATETLSRWLGPIGVRVESAQEIAGTFDAYGEHEIARHWNTFALRDGFAFHVPDAASVAVSGKGGTAVLAQLSLGLGRIALLAAPTPLLSTALRDEDHRRFALDLFRWLARARQEIADLDQDGLPNDLEDRDGDGEVDADETDPLNPDTDGDGIRDDLEDTNRNGIVDEGETSPINRDTDGDGVWDGADESPVPVVGAVFLAGIEPDSPLGNVSGPAEGGGRVLLSGRNFDPSTQIFFGDAPSPRVRYLDAARLIATVPPHPAGGGETVTVRAVSPDDTASELPESYRYESRSVANLRLRGLQATLAANRVYRGTFQLGLDVSSDVDLGAVSFTIAVEPQREIASLRLDPDVQLLRQGRQVSQRRLRPGVWAFDISAPSPRASFEDIGTLHWQSARAELAPQFRLVVRDVTVLSSTEVPLATGEAAPFPVNLRTAIPRARPR